MKVSIIIPVYNMENYIEECLDSVFAQSLKEIEVICIDDGSTDTTKKILERYRALHTNMQILFQKREGAGNARNKGLQIAIGEYIAFMDADDYYPSLDVLEKLYFGAKKNEVKIAGGNVLCDYEGRYIKLDDPLQAANWEEESKVLLYKDYQYAYGYGRYIYDRKMLLENSISFPTYIRNEDPIFMVRAFDVAEKIWVCNDITYMVRKIDKKISYSSIRVTNDLARGFLDILKHACARKYLILQKKVIGEMQKWKMVFWIHIAKGNSELVDLLKEMDEVIEDNSIKNTNGYFLDAEITEIEKYVKEYVRKQESYLEYINRFARVIIYGAGGVGKKVYDFLENKSCAEFLGFAVTDKKPSGTARGIEIKCIEEFVSYKEEGLLIIAAKDNINAKMEKNANDLGFKNILIINDDIYDESQFKMEREGFAVK